MAKRTTMPGWIVQTAFRSANDGKPFDDGQVVGMLATLDTILRVPDVPADIEYQTDPAFGRFRGQLQTGRINEQQSAGPSHE
ncbi:MAG: hypothetical protein OXU69_06440 [Gemmatimonadota bacterium]|nr:hypothetical protein [Gemmatimonadota bacterium]MDE2984325.1 hypothetical protein [Gemmatimonadota bacterium]